MKQDTPFHRLAIVQYGELKVKYPEEGRRHRLLHIVAEFWASVDPSSKTQPLDTIVEAHEFAADFDPLDVYTSGGELGVLIRTDFSDDDAWQRFYATLKSEEDAMRHDSKGGDEDACMAEDKDNDDESDDESSDSEPSSILHIVNPSPQDFATQTLLTDITNLTALRLFNDVDIRPAPTPSPGCKPVSPRNRLIDHGGWQEIYVGTSIWIYDKQSNADQCVRVVGQEGDIYGTATGDSWRAKVSHVCELQVNMAAGMRINFGGLDRWDFNERARNLAEAVAPSGP